MKWWHLASAWRPYRNLGDPHWFLGSTVKCVVSFLFSQNVFNIAFNELLIALGRFVFLMTSCHCWSCKVGWWCSETMSGWHVQLHCRQLMAQWRPMSSLVGTTVISLLMTYDRWTLNLSSASHERSKMSQNMSWDRWRSGWLKLHSCACLQKC